MKYLLPFFAALLTLAVAAFLLRALLWFSFGAGGFGVVVGGVSEKLTGLLIVLSALFVVLLAIYRRRGRRKLK
ncbi:MAG TPA: hypothetical protein VK421_01105 [Pyrinomonadaceae bacterium]|nr:hypothetical protein [Pyrinomonadaceae bacterium]